ncbi:MAG: hypothetical protein JWQ90_690 [Hydrocarboniphaga sp.]|uniref:YdbL family protein n=1 Tax=Hydrocarboniphaga sp. TaxID=2033016 RepID=UPI00261B880E|nr:YdbL family protein [Hydrocarboniphaga sp.]MDB5968240.1 hypothetical protein [Hydrocarboniphaga sp.]
MRRNQKAAVTLSVVSAAALMAMLAACVTINVYFPAAAAEKAADKIIDDVWRGAVPATPATAPEHSGSIGIPASISCWAALGAFLLPAAAAAEPNIEVTSPEVKRLSGSMEARFPLLEPLLDSGAVGLTADGYVAMRDAAGVALSERNGIRALVANENADRAALYREIALANGQAQWEAQIRNVFATRWIARAKLGWYYQDAGGAWIKK